jgi:serine O-acetyltransferase
MSNFTFRNPLSEVLQFWHSDFYALKRVQGTFFQILRLALRNPGFRCVAIYRFQLVLQRKKFLRAANFVSNVNHLIHGCEFLVGCEIGKGLIVRHPSGIVIGHKVSAGDYLILQHGVTIGEKYVGANSTGAYPHIGKSVTIGTNSVIIGDIRIGDHSIIGALSLVNRSVPEGQTVAGIPARKIKSPE